jgi:hypothetical protein
MEGWSLGEDGYPMYRLYTRLKAVKRILKKQNLDTFGSLKLKVFQAHMRLQKSSARGNIFWWRC